jgi:flagellar basal body rod protein FlgG
MSFVLLEDGSKLLQENGSGLLLETVAAVAGAGFAILLEDGSRLLQEDGTFAILLEAEGAVVVPSGFNFVDPDEITLIAI